MEKYIKNVLKFLLFFSVGGFILFLLYRNQANAYAEQCLIDNIPSEDCNYLQKLFNDFRTVRWPWLLLVLLMYMASNLSRALRWMMMFRSLGYTIKLFNALGTIMFMYFANLGLPRLGEILRPVALSKYEKVGVEKVVGTIVAERALDFIMLLLVVGLALIIEYDTLWGFIVENQALSDKIINLITNPLIYVLLVGAGISALFFLKSDYFRRTKLGIKIYGILEGLMEGIKSILNLEKPILFIGHTLFIWIMYFLMTRVCFYSYEPTSNLGLEAGLMVFVFGTLGIVFPSPGGMGSYHALIMAGLALYGVAQTDGFSYANIIFFSIQIFCNVIFGLTAYLMLPVMNKNYEGAIPIKSKIQSSGSR